MNNELTQVQNADLIFEPIHLTKETIKKYLCPLATDQELTLGLQIAKTFNLNPLKREVYFVKYGNNAMQVLTGYEVYLKRAERSGKYNGLEITSEGKISDGTLKALVKVYRKDWDHPLIHETYYSEYVQTKQDGTPNTFWKNKPITMIKKVCVSQAFRMAFPDEFDGMPYTSDEVVDQEKIIDVKVDDKLQEVKMPVPKIIEKKEEKIVEPVRPTDVIEETEVIEASKVFKSQSADPIKIITKEVAAKIVATAQLNGWSKEDFQGAIGKLGYKKSTELNEWDAEDILRKFSVKKEIK